MPEDDERAKVRIELNTEKLLDYVLYIEKDV